VWTDVEDQMSGQSKELEFSPGEGEGPSSLTSTLTW
jgi:hypothetical protein